MRCASFKHFWHLALASQAPVAIVLEAPRRFRGAVLFRGPRPSPSQGAPFWPSGLTVRRSRPPSAVGLAYSLEIFNHHGEAMKIQKIFFALVIAGSLSGCATWSTSSINNKDVSAQESSQSAISKKAPSQIYLTDQDVVDRPYKSLGDITVTVNKTTIFHPNPTREMVNEKLQKEASELGADAVILIRYGDGGISLMSWGSLEGKGRAIKYIK